MTMKDIQNIASHVPASETRERWNQIYQDKSLGDYSIASILRSHDYLLPKSGQAVDLACGMGQNAIHLARKGLKTVAWDISDKAIHAINQYAKSHGLPLRGEVMDLLQAPLRDRHFDVILVTHYLDRGMAPDIIGALNPGGILMYQTFTREKTCEAGPNNPDFLLMPNELLHLFAPLRVLAYEENSDYGDLSRGLRNEAMLVAAKP